MFIILTAGFQIFIILTAGFKKRFASLKFRYSNCLYLFLNILSASRLVYIYTQMCAHHGTIPKWAQPSSRQSAGRMPSMTSTASAAFASWTISAVDTAYIWISVIACTGLSIWKFQSNWALDTCAVCSSFFFSPTFTQVQVKCGMSQIQQHLPKEGMVHW